MHTLQNKAQINFKEIYFIFLQFILEGKFHCLSKANAKINLNYQMLLKQAVPLLQAVTTV